MLHADEYVKLIQIEKGTYIEPPAYKPHVCEDSELCNDPIDHNELCPYGLAIESEEIKCNCCSYCREGCNLRI